MTDKIAIDRSVVEQALEALEFSETPSHRTQYEVEVSASIALRAALGQPQVEQEPAIYPEEAFDMGLEAIPYYTHPQPPRQPLTDEQIAQAVRWLYQDHRAAKMGLQDDIAVARALEAAHGIKEQK